jgi:hypothetical protein
VRAPARENNDLKQQLAAAHSDAKRLHEKIDSAQRAD